MTTTQDISRSQPAWTLIALFAGAKLLVQAIGLEGYGYFRDELYYLASTEHLAWGYVDHPPLSIAALALVTWLFGEGQWAVRLVPALLGAALVAVVGWMAARLGGGRMAQALAMTAALVAPMYLALHHFYSMNAWSLLFWALASAVLLHALDGGNERTWWLLGAVLGLGLMNKVDVLWLGAGLGVGLLFSGRHLLRTRGPWIAGVLSFLIFAPHLIWQALNGWPTVEFVRNASSNKMKTVAPLDYIGEQVMTMHPFTLPIWLAGLVFLLSQPRFRIAGWIYPSVLLILVVNGTSRSGYLVGAYPLLFAAGGVALVSWLGRIPFGRERFARIAVPAYAVVLLAAGAFTAPLVLPVLSVEDYLQHAKRLGIEASTDERKEVGQLPQFYADMFGWPELAAEVARVADQLDAGERQETAIFVGNYGEAGAIRFFGQKYDLPPVLSGHNAHWMWGPDVIERHGLTGSTVIVLGGSEERHRRLFDRVELAGRTQCEYCMPYENDVPIFIARDPKVDLLEAWPQIKHYD